MFGDLHLHTHFSDGTFTPEEVVCRAAVAGLTAISLTDHDTMEGCDRAVQACRDSHLEFIPGCEFTAEMEGQEIHLLGYGLDSNHARLAAFLKRFQSVRQQRIQEMASALQALGISITASDVLTLAACNAPGRPHVGRALVALKVCRTVDEAFDRFLKKGRPAWVPKLKVSAIDALELIHEAGGVAVLAHPGLYGADELIPGLVEAGLDGIECQHTKHSGPVTQRYVNLARTHQLLVTGGSDCHGLTKGKPLIGSIHLSLDHVSALQAQIAQRQAPAATPVP